MSRPLASESGVDFITNTTTHLIADVEILREMPGVDRWAVLGLSWGTTLGLAYARAHPQRVAAIIRALVTSRAEVRWTTEHVARIFPKAVGNRVATIEALDTSKLHILDDASHAGGNVFNALGARCLEQICRYVLLGSRSTPRATRF